MKNWIRLTTEILLVAAVVGTGTFIYLQISEINELEAQVAKLSTSSVKRPPSDSGLSPVRLEQLIAKEKANLGRKKTKTVRVFFANINISRVVGLCTDSSLLSSINCLYMYFLSVSIIKIIPKFAYKKY